MSAASANLYPGRTVSPDYDRVRFVKPAFFADTIRTEYKIARYDMEKKRVFADVTCTNQRNEIVAVATNIRAHIG